MKILDFRRTKFWRDSATLQVGSLLNAAGNLVSTAALAHLLGATKQGQFFVSIALYSLLWFLVNQGVYSATVSQVAAANARGLRSKVAAWLGFLARAYLVIAVAVCVLGYFLLPLFAEYVLDTDPARGRDAWLLTLSPFLELPRIVASAALQGTRNMKPLAQTENAQESARVFLVITGAVVTSSPIGAIVGTVLASALGSAIAIENYATARRRGGDALPSLHDIRGEFATVPLRVGLPLGFKLGMLRSIDAIALQVFPALILQRLSSSDWVAYLRIAQRILGVPLMFMQGASRTALPMLSELAGMKDMERFRKTFWRACLLSGAIISTGILLTLPLVPWIVQIMLPPDFREPVWRICLILTPGFILTSFSLANDTFYLITNTLRIGVSISVILFVISMCAVAYLAWRIPTTGAAWGVSYSMASTATNLVFIAYYFRKQRREAARVHTA